MVRNIYFLGLVFLFFSYGCSKSLSSGEGGDIPDANLRAAIEFALGKVPGASITADEMATLSRLEAAGMNIRDLKGIEFATGLTRVNLRDNSISDLAPRYCQMLWMLVERIGVLMQRFCVHHRQISPRQ